MMRILQALLLCLIMTQLQAQSQQQDYTALRALYLNTSGDNWTDNTNWPDSISFELNPIMPIGTDVGTWYGVTADASGFVYCIDMDGEDNCDWYGGGGNNLTGSLPPEIDQLINLEELRLMDNNLSGSILPEIGNLSKLRRLDLVRNEISGEIPVEILNLSNLTHLYLGGNELTGSIFPGFSTLSNLTDLNLSYNYLSGSIPPELGQLSNLGNLSLSNNDLSGSIPPELGNLSSLTELFLYNNDLSGSIPPNFGNLSNLILLHLHENQLSGSIPPDLGNLSSLRYLNLYDNQLSGCYDPNLLNLCNQLDSLYTGNQYISDGNNFDVPWEDFCNITIGICNPFEYSQTDAMLVISEVDAAANETSFEVHLIPDTPISAYAVSFIINVGTPIDTNDIQLNFDDSTLDPDTYHIEVDDESKIYITIARTDKIDQILNGSLLKIVIMDDILPGIVIMDDIQCIIIGGYTVSTMDGLAAIGGSALYGTLDALISLGLNHAYCEYKGTAAIYVEDANNYTYEWSTGETTPSIGDLDIGSYTVTVSDGMGDTTVIDFDIDWAFTPLNILVQNKKKRIYIDFEETPLTEEVEISFNGGLTYRPPTMSDVIYLLRNGTYPIWIRRVDECSTYIGDFIIGSPIRPDDDFSEDLINPPFGVTARLDYELKEHGTVDISLYNIHGQRLRTLHKAASDAGEYQIELNKGGLPSGIYFIQIMFISNDGTTAYKTLKLLI